MILYILLITPPPTIVDALSYMCKKILNNDIRSLQIVATFSLNQTTINGGSGSDSSGGTSDVHILQPFFILESNQVYATSLNANYFDQGEYNSTGHTFTRTPKLMLIASSLSMPWHQWYWFERLHDEQFYHSSVMNFDIFEHTPVLEVLIRLTTNRNTIYRMPLIDDSGGAGGRGKLVVSKIYIDSLVDYRIIRSADDEQQHDDQAYLLIGDTRTKRVIVFDFEPFRTNLDAFIVKLRALSASATTRQEQNPSTNPWYYGFALYRGFGITIAEPYIKPFEPSSSGGGGGGPPLLLEYDPSILLPVGYIYQNVVYLIDTPHSMMYVFRFFTLNSVTTTPNNTIFTLRGDVNGIFGLQEYFNCTNSSFADGSSIGGGGSKPSMVMENFPIFPPNAYDYYYSKNLKYKILLSICGILLVIICVLIWIKYKRHQQQRLASRVVVVTAAAETATATTTTTTTTTTMTPVKIDKKRKRQTPATPKTPTTTPKTPKNVKK